MAAHTASGQPLHTNPTVLHHARYPEIYAPVVHGESSVRPGHPAFRSSPRPAGPF